MAYIPADFPPTIEMRGRKYCARSQVEHYKQTLLAAEPPDYQKPAVEEFVPLSEVSRELGVSRRTVGRRMASRETEAA